MGKNSEFPWDLLKVDCLRLVCTQLVQSSGQGLNYFPPTKKEDMIEFLRDIQARSLDSAVKAVVIHIQSQRKAMATHEGTSSPGKRKSEHVGESNNENEPEGVDGYNTRFKGIKRVRVRELTPERSSRRPRKPGRPRKSSTSGENDQDSDKPEQSPSESKDGSSSTVKKRGRPRKSAPEGETAVEGASADTSAETQKDKDGDGAAKESASTVYRGRGRPRNSDVAQPKHKDAIDKPKKPRGRPRKSQIAVKPTSKVFAGVVLEKRKAAPKDQVVAVAEPRADSTGEHEEEDAVLAAINAGVIDVDGTSSLGGSNKENEPTEPFRYTPDDRDADMDADGDPDGEAEPMAASATATTVITTVVAHATTTTSVV